LEPVEVRRSDGGRRRVALSRSLWAPAALLSAGVVLHWWVVGRVPDAVARAPATATVGGRQLRLEAFAARDFMPCGGSGLLPDFDALTRRPPRGSPLHVGVRVTAADGGALPADLGLDKVCVVHAGRAWSAVPTEAGGREPGDRVLWAHAGGGPMWGPGVRVDVVVRLRDGRGRGREHLLRAAGVLVERTD
jgi:hypothetical protein